MKALLARLVPQDPQRAVVHAASADGERADARPSSDAAGDFARARKAIEDYRAWLQTKEGVLDPKRTDKAQVREQAMRTQCMSNVRQMTMASIMYAQERKYFPPVTSSYHHGHDV